MADDREKISAGPDESPVDKTIAGTGPGTPDEAFAFGHRELPPAPTDEEVARIARKLGAPIEVV